MNDPANSVEAIFNDALSQPGPEQRAKYLATACGSDARLRARVEALLKAHDDAGSFMALSADASPDPSDPSGVATLAGEAVRFRPPSGSPLDVPLSEKAGSVIGRYKLLQQIGEGGFGVVYFRPIPDPF